jgi:hypothetical protein
MKKYEFTAACYGNEIFLVEAENLAEAIEKYQKAECEDSVIDIEDTDYDNVIEVTEDGRVVTDQYEKILNASD